MSNKGGGPFATFRISIFLSSKSMFFLCYHEYEDGDRFSFVKTFA